MSNQMVDVINSAGTRWGVWMVAACLDSFVLLSVVGLIWFGIRKRAVPQIGYCLFLLVPLKLLVPLVVTAPSSVARWAPSAVVAQWLESASPAIHEENPQVFGRAMNSHHAWGSSEILSTPQQPMTERLPGEQAPQNQSRAGVQSLTTDLIPTPKPAVASIREENRSWKLSLSAQFMLAWFVAIGLLLARLIHSQWKFRDCVRNLAAIEESQLPVDLQELRTETGVRQTWRIVECDEVTVPAVWGFFRPTIILPRGLMTSLTPQQIRWVLLHELAHIRRRDLAVDALQRCASVLHFFNPAVWVANRIARHLREYACDDLAQLWSKGSVEESGEAFLAVLRQGNSRGRPLDATPGLLALGRREDTFRRMRRLLDSDRPLCKRPGWVAVVGLALMALAALPSLRAGDDEKKVDSKEPPRIAGAPDGQPRKPSLFELRVIGPQGKPVSQARLDLKISPVPTKADLQTGKFLRRTSQWVELQTDEAGRMEIKLPPNSKQFSLTITTPGYAPYLSSWRSPPDGKLPAALTAALESAWTAGGVVVDQQGQPVVGADVLPSIEYSKGPGEEGQLGAGIWTKTDASGRWRCDTIPDSYNDVPVSITAPHFKPLEQRISRREFELKSGATPTARLVLDRGVTVIGRITDETGKPIRGALIRTKILSISLGREAVTDEHGDYRLDGCEPGKARLVASAKGRAIDLQDVTLSSGMDPVNFRLPLGGKLRVRVIDEQGKPEPKTMFSLQAWRGQAQGFEFSHQNLMTDAHGIWEWDEAPLDQIEMGIYPNNKMWMSNRKLVPRAQEYAFKSTPLLVISGRVIDAETRQPIPSFAVVPGIRTTKTRMNWARGEKVNGLNGRYSYQDRFEYYAHLIRIEAPGYRPVVSRDIRNEEGQVTLDFELKKGADVVATVLTPEGLVAGGARAALGVQDSQLTIRDTHIEPNPTVPQQDADLSGKIRFPMQEKPYALVITHPSGFAHLGGTPESSPTTIKLEKWARVEGTFRVGKNLVAGIPIVIDANPERSYGAYLNSSFTTTTDQNGHFVFERVLPGRIQIYRQFVIDGTNGIAEGASTGMVLTKLSAGQNATINLGGTGRPLVGRVRPPVEYAGKIPWRFVQISFGADHARKTGGPAPGPSFYAGTLNDGSFRIEDVPPGNYGLSVDVIRDTGLWRREIPVTIPATKEGQPVEPFDLGLVILEKWEPPVFSRSN
jgi:beta-lactamase regulating signal transducer with metallopeptidase domain/protocatechuate 3,4-dioxygenase beta subunit